MCKDSRSIHEDLEGPNIFMDIEFLNSHYTGMYTFSNSTGKSTNMDP